ncbi:MAG: hypothetical protein WCJ39_01120 [bacterium]
MLIEGNKRDKENMLKQLEEKIPNLETVKAEYDAKEKEREEDKGNKTLKNELNKLKEKLDKASFMF